MGWEVRRGVTITGLLVLAGIFAGSCGSDSAGFKPTAEQDTESLPSSTVTHVEPAPETSLALTDDLDADEVLSRPPAPIEPPGNVRHCTSVDVVVVLGSDVGAATGHGIRQLVVTNVGVERCVVFDEIDITGTIFEAIESSGSAPTFSTPIATAAVPQEDDFVSVVYVDPVVDVGESVGISLQYDNIWPAGSPERRIGWIDVGFGDDSPDFQFLIDVYDTMSFQAPVEIWSEYEPPMIFYPVDRSGGSPIADDAVLSTVGIGAIAAGMSLQEAADATGQTVIPTQWGEASEGCGYGRLGGTGSVVLHLNGPSNDLDEAVVSAVAVAQHRGGTHSTP